jgi:polyphosphate kinase 2 (PPK2 family)
MDAVKTAVQMSASKEQYMMDKGVDILKQLSNKSHEEQLRQMQERIQMRQRQPKGE